MIGIEKPSIEALDLTADGTYGKFRTMESLLSNRLKEVTVQP